MKHTNAYNRMNEATKLQLRLMAKDFTHACKYSDDNRIQQERLLMMYYTNALKDTALKDTALMTPDEVEELWEAMTEEGNKAYAERNARV